MSAQDGRNPRIVLHIRECSGCFAEALIELFPFSAREFGLQAGFVERKHPLPPGGVQLSMN